ncbi:ABC transporter permease [Candidatus Epulonipiscium fishelsonii]|uniref:ABC transporter permease n=1 Tax=Candidatus Epulonipiscium fishelsonii TaxID=77094 RepID=A0ACC8XCQ9_9FIRM|nr:ABC transporter permease [Epulopiscium sp. SCG-B11WGA-EpuloA1]ONI43206.1 ABC transporter permease [Epulopiscium sp. SCG-B05WGA-EpuloA1]
MANNKIKQSTGEKVFTVFNYMFFIILSLVMIYPFWHVVMSSLSSADAAMQGGIFLWPREFTIDTYEQVFKNRSIFTGYVTTLMVTVVGTVLGTFFTATTAYALSKKEMPFSGIFLFLVVFTMLFSGGMIPNYLLIKDLGLINNRWSLILPGLISAYNVIIMKSYFQSIPSSLEESAKIDGANEVIIFLKIILPLSKATVATIALFMAVGYWNDYFSTVLYINDQDKWALQAVLRYMLTNTNQAMQNAGVSVVAATNVTATTIKSASIVVATVPILIVYPFVQKYFVKGVMIGGVKG